MGIIIGLLVTFGCVLGGFMAVGGHVGVLIQPYEALEIVGAALGCFIIANSLKVVKDTGKAIGQAFKGAVPKEKDYLETLGVLHSLMRELKTKSRSEVEAHIDNPKESAIFALFPIVQKNHDLTQFICDYCRIIIIGNARSHEVEALMEEEIHTIRADSLKPYHSLTAVGDGLPAIGIIAAVLGVTKAMGSLNESPEVLGELIAAALVGTLLGIFISYCLISPIATKIKVVREKKNRLYIIVKQTLIAYMNGSLPQVAIEFGRKTISAYERPSIDAVEQSTMNLGGDAKKAA